MAKITTTENNTFMTADIEAIENSLADLEIEEIEAQPVEENLDAILDDLPLGDAEVAEAAAAEDAIVAEEIAAMNKSGVLDDDTLRELDLGIARTEAYEAQEAPATASEEDIAQSKVDAEAKKARKTARTAATGAPKTPRLPRDLNTVLPEFFVLTGDPSTMDAVARDAAKAATLALVPTQKKIAEKFENLFTALSVGKAPSNYTVLAFRLLDEKKAVTSADIVAAYRMVGAKSATEGYDEGTARSQCGQMMKLFEVVGIASRSSQTLTLKTDSLVAERLRGILAA